MAAIAGMPKELTVFDGTKRCKVTLVEGLGYASLAARINSFFKLGGAPFHLTVLGSDVVVPLTSALPDGMELILHTEFPRAVVSFAPMGKAPEASEGPFTPVGRAPEASAGSPVAASSALSDSPVAASSALPLLAARQVSPPAVSVTSQAMSQGSLLSRQQQVQEAAETLDKATRVSIDLTNERTLLAWMRTAMACVRTVLSFLFLTATGLWFEHLNFARLGMCCGVVAAATVGVLRYWKIKQITGMVHVPRDFDRVSTSWFLAIIGVGCALTVGGLYMMAFARLVDYRR
eukprot:TRINITY_DN12696_c0_g1_i1.p1 TRINITY_DN12696_c0_g1~~TRINITY_DN12696_c0_g1_i1.p1  ORF type:complete len:290 (-),score=34.92 TRINITY_DN12696_c0_g1_i1:107-976(-)